MWAYVDETGNTGNHIFDEEQPFFVTAAMMTKTNFDLTCARGISAIAAAAGVEALHANKLGMARVETIAPALLRLLKKADAQFFVARLEKRYLAATKVVDTYFDQGENLAVPWHLYWIRHMRLTLTFKLASFVITEEIAQTVWNCVTATSESKSKEHFRAGAVAMLKQMATVKDVRFREVVTEALEWALDNPENFSTYLRDKINRYGHSPNFVAFTLLLDGLDRTSKSWGRRIREIVHDQQSQFEKTIVQWHEVISRPAFQEVEPYRWPGEDEPISVSKVPGSAFRMSSEEESAGLQVIDVILWLFKRMFDDKDFGPESARLTNWVLRRAYLSDFSFDGVAEAAGEKMRVFMDAEFTDEQMAKGAEQSAEFESSRKKAMAGYARAKRQAALSGTNSAEPEAPASENEGGTR